MINQFAKAFVIVAAVLVGWFLSENLQSEDLVCNPNEVIALHETEEGKKEKLYPAWKYICAEGYSIVILD